MIDKVRERLELSNYPPYLVMRLAHLGGGAILRISIGTEATSDALLSSIPPPSRITEFEDP